MIVESPDGNLRTLQDLPDHFWLAKLYGLDTETVGCNPKVESPIGRARIWCMTVSWEGPGGYWGALLWEPELVSVKPWLESAEYLKVGSGLYDFDIHAVANHGIALAGIEACTWYTSRMINPDGKGDDGHGLKVLGKQVGEDMVELKTLLNREVAVPGKVKAYKRDSKVTKGEWPVIRVAEAEFQEFKYATVRLPIDKAYARGAAKDREVLVRYAIRDARTSLKVHNHLKGKIDV